MPFWESWPESNLSSKVHPVVQSDESFKLTKSENERKNERKRGRGGRLDTKIVDFNRKCRAKNCAQEPFQIIDYQQQGHFEGMRTDYSFYLATFLRKDTLASGPWPASFPDTLLLGTHPTGCWLFFYEHPSWVPQRAPQIFQLTSSQDLKHPLLFYCVF